MEFLQPVYLWGLLGMSIPLLIHLWNGRRGRVLDWAAMNWLSGQESQTSRSVKLEHLLLLLTRMLLLAVLVLLAVGFWFDFLEKSDLKPTVHLVVPNLEVEAEFRFELEQAMEKGEPIYWLAPELPEYESGILPTEKADPSSIQQALDLLPKNLDTLHLYSAGFSGEFPDQMLYVPEIPVLHLKTGDVRKFSTAHLALDSARFLSVNETGILQLNSLTEGKQLKSPVHSGPVRFRLLLKDSGKEREFLAGLEAIEEVYGLTFSEVDEGEQMVLTDQIPESFANDNIYLLTESSQQIFHENVKVLENQAGMSWEELVEKGLLPGLILEPLVDFLGIHPKEARLSPIHLAQQFVRIPESSQGLLPNSNGFLLILFLVLFGLERYLAYRTNL